MTGAAMTDVVSIEPRDLPRVSARDAAALTRAARLLAGLPRRVETALGDLGSVVLTVGDVSPLGTVPSGEAAGDVVLGISRGLGAGRLVIDGALARWTVALALRGEVRIGASLARLGLGEHGVVAGLVASLLHALGSSFSVSLVAPGPPAVASGGGVAIALTVTVAGVAGWVRLEVPAAWLASTSPSRARDAELGALAVEVRVELARTSLAAGELAGLVPGDAVVFDGEPSLASRSGAQRPVRVVVGAHAARARLADDGRVTLEERLEEGLEDAFEAGLEEASERALRPALVSEGSPEEVSMDGVDDVNRRNEETLSATVVLAAAPIEVVAELGRLTLRGDEVVGLGPGAVLALGRAGASPVVLRVGGEIWAEGELCDVDGALGVRVTATRRSGLPPR
jgi:type III secretion system YscQ/HrcQ family protein